jgi:hypothetical protein
VRFVFLVSPVDHHLWESFKRYRKESPRAQITAQIAEADDDDDKKIIQKTH